MNTLLKQAFKSRLTASSLWALPTRQRARENYRLFTETATTRTITMRSIIERLYLSNQKIVLCQFLTAIGAVLFHYANPFFLRKLLNYIQEHHHEQHPSSEVGYLYCVALFACNVTSTLVASQTLLWGRRWHVTITHMLNAEIYAHTLRAKDVHHTTKKTSLDDDGDDQSESEEEEDHDESIQRQASLMSQDTERLAELASYLHVSITK